MAHTDLFFRPMNTYPSWGFIARALRAFALFLALLPAPLMAQTGILFVRVNGPAGPVANATVDVLFQEQVIRRAGTDAEGAARIGGLPGGTFQVRIESLGFRTHLEEEVRVEPGTSQAIEVLLVLAPIEMEGITIHTERVQIQRENTEFNTTVEEAAILLLPVTHTASDLIALTPGARPGHVWGGASLQANNYRIDGLSANHPGLGGDLLQPSVTWIDRIDVRGLGAGAEYGGFQGGLIDVVTKSGSNELQGSFSTAYENDVFNSTNLVGTEIGREVAGRTDLEGEVRGPLIRDELFYYLSGKYVGQDLQALNHLTQVEGTHAPFFEERTETKLFGKMTWTPGLTHFFEVSGAYTDTRADNFELTGFEAEGATQRYSSPTWFVNAAARELLGSWGVVEARVNHFSRDERYDPYGGQETPGISTFTLTPPYTAYGNSPYTLRSAPSSTSANIQGTFRLTTGELEHRLKVGGEYSWGSFLDQRIRNGGMTWAPVKSTRFDPADPATWSHAGSNFVASQWGGEVDLDADVANMAVYAQSSISLGSRVVLSPGVRWNRWMGWLTPKSGERFQAVQANGLDPRIGISVDITRDGTFVAKGHWGRYHQNMISQMFDRVAGADVFTNEEIWYYKGTRFSDPTTTFTQEERDALAMQGVFSKLGEIILNETGPVSDYRQPYVDQWLVGLERQVGDWLKFEALYTRRSNGNMVALVDRNRATNYTRFERVRVFDTSGDVVPFQGGSVYLQELYLPNNLVIERLKCKANADCPDDLNIPGLSYSDTLTLSWNPDYVLTNAPDGRRDFGQFQLTMEIALPDYGASLSFVRTHLEGNLDNVSGYTDPMGYGAGPYVRVNEGVNSFGTLENFADNEWKVSVWGMLPFQLRGGAFWTFQSGDHYSPRFRLYGIGFNQYRIDTGALRPNGIPTRPGQEVDFRLLYPMEGHYVFVGPRGLPTLERRNVLDVRLERMFKLRDYDLAVSLDVFNILRNEAITSLNTIVNNGPDYGYSQSQSMFAPPLEPNQYYAAPQNRVKPRSIRMGMAVYF
ncbi:carboxypeptidase regulatory-like domain-containing protein [Gemmatimonadota bacterium]